jgi:hypothetical protein
MTKHPGGIVHQPSRQLIRTAGCGQSSGSTIESSETSSGSPDGTPSVRSPGGAQTPGSPSLVSHLHPAGQGHGKRPTAVRAHPTSADIDSTIRADPR